MRITRLRLSDKTSRLRPRHVVPKPAQTYEPEACRDAGRAGSLHPRLPCASAVGSVQTLRWVGARSPGRPFLSERSLRPPVFHTPTFVEGVPPSVAAMGLPAVRRRPLLQPLALFVSPFAAYAVYLALRARYPLEIEHWTSGHVSILTLLGLAAAVLGLVALNVLGAAWPGQVRAGARRERGARPGANRMSRLPGLKDGRLRDVGPLRHGALAQALEALNGDGAE